MDFVAAATEFKSCHHGICLVVCCRIDRGTCMIVTCCSGHQLFGFRTLGSSGESNILFTS